MNNEQKKKDLYFFLHFCLFQFSQYSHSGVLIGYYLILP